MKRKNKGLAGFYNENKALVWAGGFGLGLAIIYGIYRATSKGGAANVGKFANASMNNTSTNAPTTQTSTNAPTTQTSINTGAGASSGFPLKVGSKGAVVKEMQQYLIDIAGTKRILPKYGADGDFGSEAATALKTYFGVSEVTEAQFAKLKEAAPMWWRIPKESDTGFATVDFREAVLKSNFPNFNKTALLNIDKQAR